MRTFASKQLLNGESLRGEHIALRSRSRGPRSGAWSRTEIRVRSDHGGAEVWPWTCIGTYVRARGRASARISSSSINARPRSRTRTRTRIRAVDRARFGVSTVVRAWSWAELWRRTGESAQGRVRVRAIDVGVLHHRDRRKI